MQLLTQKNFTIVRQLGDPSTSGNTYYVRAVIRNAYTDVILATLNMNDKGSLSQRFTKDWTVPADPSGEGFYVSIITTVYSDSGYTTKSTDYGEEENTYLVADRQVFKNGGNGVNNGGGLARRDVRDIFQEEFAKIAETLKPEKIDNTKISEPKDYDARFNEIMQAVQSIEPAEKVELGPINKILKSIKAKLDSTEISKFDLTPVLDELKNASENNELTADEMKSIIADLEKKMMGELNKNISEAMKNTSFVTSFITHPVRGNDDVSENKKIKIEESLNEPIDIRKLTG